MRKASIIILLFFCLSLIFFFGQGLLGCGKIASTSTSTSISTSTSTSLGTSTSTSIGTSTTSTSTTTSTTSTTLYSITILNCGTTEGLTRVSFSDANYGWVAGLEGVLYKTSTGGTSWEPITNPGTGHIWALHVFDANNAWICQNNALHKTTNGGTSFLPGQPAFETFCLFFRTTSLGWATGNYGNISTTTNGSTWTSQTSGTNENFIDTFFIDDLTGWTVGRSMVLKTTDGGTNWISHSLDNVYYPSSISFSDQNTGWIASNSGILKSTDSGESWSLFTPEADRGNIIQTCQIRFIDSDHGMLIGEIENQPDKWLYYTNNGGDYWFGQPLGTSETIQNLNIVDMNTAYAVASNGIIIKISK